ncbi:hypothetical protein H5119_09125 [Pseudoalteromonas sp. SG45-5]|uniref:hypothetical protein n=1 Tax=unclassified Pseudoalteromonas TaxID=194690 RepID=UPI0015F7A0BE|nr:MULTISPECIES: hypothetical protein [unclassified Pseudoalteromonas]MBB1385700.1 hypothetical protein [Pseudoalteromonas sp. SG45-5]MBB1393537.1 hypothetical protein [Pseudoalteromonas sp. SG44-4]MBB1447451.1 hypothetical protein [Pseudoalteromonas sp. SG41-6]
MRVLLSLCFIASASVSNFAQATTAEKTSHAEVDKKKAVILAKQTIDGKTLKITEKTDFYTVRILKSDGHVVDLHINKKTGEVKKD